MNRESFMADVITPKVEVPNVPPGLLKWGVFVRLKDSPRSSSVTRSVKLKLRNMEKSKFFRPGPTRIFRPTLPNVRSTGAENFDVSNHVTPVRTTPKIGTSPLTFGRLL